MKTRFVLFLVEDDDSIRLVLKHLFESENFLVFESENGNEAMEKLMLLKKAGIPDLILTDLQMPQNGGKLIDALAKNAHFKKIPVIPMSASGISHISGKKVIAKPLNLKALIELVHSTIDTDRADRHLDEKEKT
jgi:CheY-like chemotaxis protein